MSKVSNSAVMVIGGGIAGMQSALDLANYGVYVYLIEKSSSVGGIMSKLDKTFPTNDCAMWIISPILVEVGRNQNINIITMSEVTNISGKEGSFKVDIYKKSRYVDEKKCVACNACAEKCPKKVDDSYNEKLIKRKAIYLKYPQAVPLKYAIDEKNCIYFKNGRCKACQKFCPTNAIDFNKKSKIKTLKVSSIIFSPGCSTFDPSVFDNYAYKKHNDVITSMEMERILSASGPTQGKLVRLSDKEKNPKSIAWIQCVGSRDINKCSNPYCSSVCCMYAIKEAIVAKEHLGNDLECVIFYIDLRTHGKDFEYYYNNAKNKGVKFIRSKVHTIDPIKNSSDLSLRYINDHGKLITDTFEMVVLSVGIEIGNNSINTAKKLGLILSKGNFCKTTSFNPSESSKKGIYVCGAFQGPKDIPQSIIDAGAAASSASEVLSNKIDRNYNYINKIKKNNTICDSIRIGVFICMCGKNIAGIVDVENVKNFVSKLPYVEYVSNSLYACSKDAQDKIVEIINKNNLNRIVVAACTPKTHENIFQDTLISAGLNKYLFEMCNIRNHISWVHKKNPQLATKKAKNIIRMSVSKASLIMPLNEIELDINQNVLVIGGGISGITAALDLSKHGYSTHIVEKTDKLGGNALNIYKTSSKELVQTELSSLINMVNEEKNITIHLNTEISNVEGFVGNFTTILESKKDKILKKIEHGITIIATGGLQYKPIEYNYKKDERILTSLELDKKLIKKELNTDSLKSIVFIQCVGSRNVNKQGYCSRLCCTHSVLNALELKKIYPYLNIYILYRDMRTYGENEYLYYNARKNGIIFIRYNMEYEPIVSSLDKNILIKVYDNILDKILEIKANMLVLASSILPNKVDDISRMFKIPLNKDNFFAEKHSKLGPSEFSTEGIFLCGIAHYPKPINESILQAKSSVSKAISLLSKKKMYMSGNVASVNIDKCSYCGTCIDVCPYSAPFINKQNSDNRSAHVEINQALCKGCGICTSSCRSGAINLNGFDNNQILAQISSIGSNF